MSSSSVSGTSRRRPSSGPHFFASRSLVALTLSGTGNDVTPGGCSLGWKHLMPVRGASQGWAPVGEASSDWPDGDQGQWAPMAEPVPYQHLQSTISVLWWGETSCPLAQVEAIWTFGNSRESPPLSRCWPWSQW